MLDEHPGLLLTAGYFVLTLVGLIYEFWLYRSFRINIVDWAETTDFLLGAVRTPLVILLSLLPVPIAFAIDRGGKWLRVRFPRYGAFQAKQEQVLRIQPHHRIYYSAVFVFTYAVLFTQLYAFRVARQIRSGRGRIVRVIPTGAPQATMIQGVLIGTTSKYLFLYDSDRVMTRVLPVENIAEVMISRRRSGFADSPASPVTKTAPPSPPAPAQVPVRRP